MFVDEGMRPLIEFLNRGGWATVYTCRGSADLDPRVPDCPYVLFESAAALARANSALAELALAAGDHALAARALGKVTAPVGPPGRRWVQTKGLHWRLEVDWNLHADWEPSVSRVLTATLRLGSANLAAVTDLLARSHSARLNLDLRQRPGRRYHGLVDAGTDGERQRPDAHRAPVAPAPPARGDRSHRGG